MITSDITWVVLVTSVTPELPWLQLRLRGTVKLCAEAKDTARHQGQPDGSTLTYEYMLSLF